MFSLGWDLDDGPGPRRVPAWSPHVQARSGDAPALSFLIVCQLSASRSSLRYSLTAIRENDNPCANGCCAPTENPPPLDGFDDGEEAKPIINRVGNPVVSYGNVAEMNVSMPIRHGMFVARFSALADEHERLAWSKVLVRIAATVDPGRRFFSELCYPA